MLRKFLNVQKLKPSRNPLPAGEQPPRQRPKQYMAPPVDSGHSILKIVHAGGGVESYYMATPAAKILEKYPSFVLARPEVFMRPWDSVVKPDVILTPGEKVFLVPRRTVRKLRRRIRRPIKDFSVSSFVSQSSMDVSTVAVLRNAGNAVCEASDSDASICSTISRKKNDGKKHVTFSGIKKHVTFAGLVGLKLKEKDHNEIGECSSQSSNSMKSSNKGKRVRIVTWEPTLTAITETHGNDVMKC